MKTRKIKYTIEFDIKYGDHQKLDLSQIKLYKNILERTVDDNNCIFVLDKNGGECVIIKNVEVSGGLTK